LASLQLSTVLRNAPPATLSPEVSRDAHAFDAVAWIPLELWVSLSTGPKARFPVALGHQRKDRPYRQLHLLRSFTPSTSPFAPVRVSPNLVAATLLVFCPSRDLTAQTLDPRTRLSPCGNRLEPSPAGSDPRLQGPSRPLGSRVKPPQNISALARLRRQYPILFRTGPHRLSAATPSPLTFQPMVSHRPWPSELLSIWEVDSSPWRSVDLVWGFLPPRATSKLRSPADPGSCFHRDHRYVSPRTQRTLWAVL
jgi:hypothetical protein